MIVQARSPADIKRANKRASTANVYPKRASTIVATPDHLKLTEIETDALTSALIDLAITMDDDGEEGTFAASPLAGILAKLRAIRRNRGA